MSCHRSTSSTATTPKESTPTPPSSRGWRDRLVDWDLLSSDPARPHFLEPHDLAVAKLAAGREKDTTFVDALIRVGLLRVAVIRDRADLLPRSADVRLEPRIQGWLDVYDGGRGPR